MTLTTHAVVGSAATVAVVGAVGLTPVGVVLGFAAGFVSHFAIDAVPHWAEGRVLLRSSKFDKDKPLETDLLTGSHQLRDLTIICGDGLLGLFLSLFIFSFSLFHLPIWLVFLGAAAGESPDALQFVYFKTRLKVMEPLQLFHTNLQTEYPDVRFLAIEVLFMIGAVALATLFI